MPQLVKPFRELTPEQQKIVENATSQKDWLFIEGPPGSGKTLVSLHIVKALIGTDIVKPLVLIYNNSLLGYLKSSFEQLGIKDAITISTKDQFFWDLRKQYNIELPQSGSFEEKRKKILTSLLEKNIDLRYSIIILDEIQDFTQLEWVFLKKLSNRFILLGDFDQRVYDSDLDKKTLLSDSKYEFLKTIFRFGKAIAKLVQVFSKSKKDLEGIVSRVSTINPIIYDKANISEENQEIEEIIGVRRGDAGRIAVISISKDRLAYVHNYLDSKGIVHFHAPNPSDFQNYDFSSNDPVLITSASAKGLEFETVIVVGFDHDSPAVFGFKKHGGFEENIYVSLSRATEHLYVLRNPKTVPELNKLIVEQQPESQTDWF